MDDFKQEKKNTIAKGLMSFERNKINRMHMNEDDAQFLRTPIWLVDDNIYVTFIVFMIYLLIFSYLIVLETTDSQPASQESRTSQAPQNIRHSYLILESVNWFNYVVKKWWTFSKTSIERLVADVMNKILSNNLPPFIDSFEVNRINIGKNPPTIRNIRIYDFDLDSVDTVLLHNVQTSELCLEVDLSLALDDFVLVLSGRGEPYIVCLMLEQLFFEGTLRIIVFLDKRIPFPHVHKARISLSKEPTFKFSVHVLGLVNLMQIPLLKSWIYKTILDQLTRAMVEPAGLEIMIQEHVGSYID